MPDPVPDGSQQQAEQIKGWWTIASKLFTGSVERRMVTWMLWAPAALAFILTTVVFPFISAQVDKFTGAGGGGGGVTVIQPAWESFRIPVVAPTAAGTGSWQLTAPADGWVVESVESRIVTAATSTTAPWKAVELPWVREVTLSVPGAGTYLLEVRFRLLYQGKIRTERIHSSSWFTVN